jgi:tRNA 2-thiocytidine biosynthesis protein TtcA
MSSVKIFEIKNTVKSSMNDSSFVKLQKKLTHKVGKAIHDFNMIENGDKIMVCLSGGKDSYTMLDILLILQKKAPIKFSIIAVNLDQKQPGFPSDVLPEYLNKLGVEYDVIESDTYSVVKRVIPEGEKTCGLCSRMRRGILYRYAKENQISKVALGHHKDDIIETFFLNIFFGGRVKAMPAKLRSDDGENVIIRPLAYANESEIEKYSNMKGFPIIPCNLCGSQENLQRQNIKKILAEWDKEYPNRKEVIFKSLSNVSPSQMLDHNLFDFKSI